jgi:uncharacterized oxidoreductase
MRMRGNTIFITGGSSGIGKGLAEAFHKLGNQVIITGRREALLKDICAVSPGMRYFVLDVTQPNEIRRVAANAIAQFPGLNCVFNNAGMQIGHDFSADGPLDDRALVEEIDTNLLGVIRVAAGFLPHLKKKENAVMVNVSSGLAFVPLARYPIYCATKAAVHSLTLSMRRQLEASGVKVIELIPPYVETELGGPNKTAVENVGAPKPMPLSAFIEEAMTELAGDGDDVAIGMAKSLAAASGNEMKKAFAGMNL